MALSILDGNQSATTLSTILSSGQHITAHTVVSLGTQAITDMRSAVSGSVVSISNFPASQSTTFGAVTGSVSVLNFPASQAVTFTDASLTNTQLRASAVTVGGTVTVGNSLTISSLPAISGTVTAGGRWYDGANYQPTPFLVTEDGALETVSALVQPIPAGTNRIGVVTIGAGTVTIGAGTSQIGSVTASISGTVPISISSVTVGNSVTIGSLPALAAGTAQIGSVTASISNTVVTFYPMQGTTVTNSNFTSTTASTTLVSAVAGRDVLTVFNEGAGNLFISPGATATTISYQVRLSAGDYWECPEGQRSLIHTAVFATAGTARVTEVS
jgi:hypothetical protein